ncbi:MAG: outer membrane protein assembly factor BamB family protein [Planctomycetaceae bacterium]
MPDCTAGLAARRMRRWRAPSLPAVAQGLLYASLVCGAAYGHDPGRGPPSDTGPPGPSKSAVSPVATDDAANRDPPGDAWHPNLIRERPIEVRLRTARAELTSGNVVEALSILQAILNRDDDLFARLERQVVPVGAHVLAEDLLRSAPPEALATYETLFGGEARRLFDAATAHGDPERLAQVVRRFFYTAAGFDAALRLAHTRLDCGAVHSAAACWQRLLSDPVQRRRLKPMHRAAAALAFMHSGRAQEAREALQEISQDRLTFGGRDSMVASLRSAISHVADRLVETRFAMVGMTADRNGAAAGSIASLARARWSISLAGSSSRHVAELAQHWEPFQLQQGLPVGTANFPLIAGGKVFFRDYEGIRAVDLSRGATQWFYETGTSLARELPPRSVSVAEGNPDPNNQMLRLVGNCLLGMLTADDARLYALDQQEHEPTLTLATAVGETSTGAARSCQILIALPLAASPEAVFPLWIAGGAADSDSAAPRSLPNHSFVGPPLPLDDRLFAISEYRQQLYLSCLRPQTGSVIWSQALCSVPHPMAGENRLGLVCMPSYAEGTLVCGTQSGVLVALNPVTGRLLWAAPHDDNEPQGRQQMSAWPYTARRRLGHAGYPNFPLLSGGRVLYLPAHSEYLHCHDLASGRLLWRTRREDLDASTASEYVAAVDRGVVLLVGRRQCRALDVETGAPRYRVRLAGSPCGRGVRLENSYHVPLDSGAIVAFDIETGQTTAESQAPNRMALGNLLVAGDLIVSMSRTELTVWPQAATELSLLEKQPRLKSDSEAILNAAELELSLGNVESAKRRLEGLPQRLPETLVARARGLAWRIALSEVSAAGGNREGAISRLSRLSHDAGERCRYLLERACLDHQLGRDAALTAAARELERMNLATMITILGDPSRRVRPLEFVAALVEQRALLTGPVDADHQFEVELGRLERAASHTAAGRLQQAELLLIELRHSARPEIAGAATRLLAELWQSRQFDQPAALLLEDLQTRFARVAVRSQATGADFVAGFPRHSRTWEAYRRLARPAWSGLGVRITESQRDSESLNALFNGVHAVQPPPMPRRIPFDLIDKGKGGAGPLVLVDRHTGAELPDSIALPGRILYPVSSQPGYLLHSFVGSLFPVGGPGCVHGVSLLERRVVWTATLDDLDASRDCVRVGPAGPRFAACQWRHHLFVLDPADGRLKWRRDDIEPLSGLTADPHGIVGDDRALVVFAGNGANYTMYDTATGEELRRGRLDIQTRPFRRAFGRRFFHFTGAETRRVRVWDPLTDCSVWEAPLDDLVEASAPEVAPPGTKVLSFVRETDEATFVTREGRLCVIDAPTGVQRFSIQLPQALMENLACLRAFRDRERYYFHLQRTPTPGMTFVSATSGISDSLLPTVHVPAEGELLAVDVATHELLWHTTLGARSILHLPDLRLPVLVTLCRVRHGEQQMLGVEVRDVRTGELLASRDDLLSDRLLNVTYEREPGQLVFRGGKTEIRLEFPTDVAQLLAPELPR